MLQFSEQALVKIRDAMAAKMPRPSGLRIGVVGSPCSGVRYIIRLEQQPNADDQVVQCQGVPLYVDVESYPRLQGVRVGFIEEGERRGFTFDNPNLANSCAGCPSTRAGASS
ncbi:iron-sulfur cluster assembly accessory protein [Motiliproteus sp. SC1-56]|uniref:HesB/IscA family protein n=1 Tax=Motiliproteus sp. SC1-56 TaxID=2799565 RepID=UPI001A8E1CFA|nr:iron-sulfur cluster assembly accessory protein [Motiliproteus sp. SC1-56]